MDGIEVKEFDGSLARMAVTTLIMSDKALSEMRKEIDLSLFPDFMTKSVVEWCLDFYDKYGKAPKYHIKDLYLENIGKLDEATSELIDGFLSSISDQYSEMEEFNEEFAIDQLVRFLNLAHAGNLLNEVGDALDAQNVERAIEQIKDFRPMERVKHEEKSFADLMKKMKLEEREILFEYPGVLKELLGSVTRSSFTAILSPEKRGKSFFLLYLAKLVAKNRHRVLYLSVGDMTLNEIALRTRLMSTGIDPLLEHSKTIYKPVLDCKHALDGSCMEREFPDLQIAEYGTIVPEMALSKYPDHTPCTECRHRSNSDFKPCVWWEEKVVKPVSEEEYEKLVDSGLSKFEKQCGQNGALSFSFFPTKTCAPADIEYLLKRAVDEKKPYDVLIVDYMDILAAPSRAKRMDERNQINATWEEMRRISQAYNIGLITATQGRRDMYNEDADQESTSEDKRKAAHVTCMFALNQKPHEKSQGIIRVSPLFRRDGECDLGKEAVVLTCFGLGKVHIGSFLSYKSFRYLLDKNLAKRNKKPSSR